jgi:hypothetical protein
MSINCVGKGFEGGRGLFQGAAPEFAGESGKAMRTSVRTVGNPVKIRTVYFLNVILERCRSTTSHSTALLTYVT